MILELTPAMAINDPAITIARRVERARARKAHNDMRAKQCREARLRFVGGMA